MKTRNQPVLVADLSGGEIVRCHAGLVRMTSRTGGGERWANLLNEDLSEVPRGHIWLAPTTRVLEVIQAPQTRAVAGEEVDPLQGLR